jgi:hypothetical protein
MAWLGEDTPDSAIRSYLIVIDTEEKHAPIFEIR